MRKDKVGALVILALSIVYGAMALNIPEAPGVEGAGVTPSSLPIALSATGIVASLLILVLPAPRRIDRDMQMNPLSRILLRGWIGGVRRSSFY